MDMEKSMAQKGEARIWRLSGREFFYIPASVHRTALEGRRRQTAELVYWVGQDPVNIPAAIVDRQGGYDVAGSEAEYM